MRIFVSSRCRVSIDIQKAEKENPENKIISICISDPGSKSVNIPIDESDVLRLSFYDLDEKYPSTSPTMVLFNQEMAQQIKTFVEQKLCDNLIIFVSCEAGISRSAGVAGALAKYFNDDDSMFFSNASKYLPNRLVYRLLLNLLNGQENSVPNVVLNGDFDDNNYF